MDASSINMREFLREVEKQIPLQLDFRIESARDGGDVKNRIVEKLNPAGIETATSEEHGVIVDIPASRPGPPAVAVVVSLSQSTDIVIGLTVASVVNQFQNSLPEKVRLIFAPDLNSPNEIARQLQWEDATIPVFVGFNIGHTVAPGQVAVPIREITIASHDFTLSVSTEQPERDVIQVAAQIVTNLNQILTRKTDPLISVRIAFSSIQSLPENTRPRTVTVEGRVYLREDIGSSHISTLLDQTIATVCKTYGADYQLDFKPALHSLKVDSVMSRHLRESAAEVLGKDKIFILEYPGHEFASLLEYFKHVPGGVMQIGAAEEHDNLTVSAAAILAGVKTLGWTLLNKSH